ncbi:biotin-dependent carboxyltransferase family protein [Flavimarina sp. Hel_I_48]|uniref:5-oxoprolinase subunit C family protein n=1 Tax=Flavimarina sp. Hel_I_48 TaxID=1392488 RepID=UPI0004DF52EF|nr:biotin-dependent carboxyltransferase family protein [Flavimarina sp. Hel_I_48]
MANIEIISPGFYTSVQDLGRFGIAGFGVPQAGVMDSFSAKKANLLLGNKPNDAVLEITFSGPKLRFSTQTTICVCGAAFELRCNGERFENDKPYVVNPGDQLDFGALKVGFRAYLAISGGINTPLILNSRSQYAGITSDFRLKKGAILPLFDLKPTFPNTSARVQFENKEGKDKSIEVIPGPEYDLLQSEQKRQLFETPFTLLPTSNRMAIQFKEEIRNSLEGITTSVTMPGTVQLTPQGKLLVLMRDCQITGGYPRILQLNEMGINTISQQMPGKSITFKMSVK